MKKLLYTTELLSEPAKGIYTITYYYSDGTFEERKVPKGIIIIPKNIYTPSHWEENLVSNKPTTDRWYYTKLMIQHYWAKLLNLKTKNKKTHSCRCKGSCHG